MSDPVCLRCQVTSQLYITYECRESVYASSTVHSLLIDPEFLTLDNPTTWLLCFTQCTIVFEHCNDHTVRSLTKRTMNSTTMPDNAVVFGFFYTYHDRDLADRLASILPLCYITSYNQNHHCLQSFPAPAYQVLTKPPAEHPSNLTEQQHGLTYNDNLAFLVANDVRPQYGPRTQHHR